MERYYIVYEGRVQGVGFRWRIIQIARSHGLSGYVRNCDNGNVECEVQGEDIDGFLAESLANDRFAIITDHHIRQLPLKEGETGFNVRF
ncbi:MAG: acylphosphatase [Erysipelotrichaceae bacterium]|nr:acylphosphatase [Erysipelotrichaceae bacterium]